MTSDKIIITGGAGLVGQNLVARLKQKGYRHLVVLDKNQTNLTILHKLHPDITAVCTDLSEPGEWAHHFKGAESVVQLQAQIGGTCYDTFVRNNLSATQQVLEAIQQHRVSHLIHISSSVVESVADDFYTNTKKAQETLVRESGIRGPILRPTLMFGWFDRKHLGWLSHFMRKAPLFPIPGHGRYLRQPLYVGDFCNLIMTCLEKKTETGTYLIAGQEKIDYIDIIRKIRDVQQLHTPIVPVPYPLFYALLWVCGHIKKNPPFTTQQLAALTAGDEFATIDWPRHFGIPYTPFHEAIKETFTHPVYSQIRLEF